MIIQLTQLNNLKLAIDTDDISGIRQDDTCTHIYMKKSRCTFYVSDTYSEVLTKWIESNEISDD